jgi:hypothetical protein
MKRENEAEAEERLKVEEQLKRLDEEVESYLSQATRKSRGPTREAMRQSKDDNQEMEEGLNEATEVPPLRSRGRRRARQKKTK